MTPGDTVSGRANEPRPEPRSTEAPSPWIVRFAPLLPAGCRVLDVACGRGRHSRFLAARGCIVTAIDRDEAALRELDGVSNVRTVVADLETGAWPSAVDGRFDAIVVTRYLHRPLFPQFLRALADDGVFLYETFAAGNAAFGRPTNPDFLLEPDELLERTRDHLTVVAFEQGLIDDGNPAVLQRIAAVGRRRPWPPHVR